MSSRLGVRLVTLALTAAVTLSAPVAAHAGKAETQDPSGDVVELTNLDDEQEAGTPAPDFTAVDILRTSVDHRAARLRLSVRYRDLYRTPFHSTMFRVVTPKRAFWVSVDRGLGHPKGGVDLTRNNSGRSVKCKGLRFSIDLDTDRVSASVPSRCIGSPRWVKVGSGALSPQAGQLADPDDFSMFVDDGHRAGSIGETLVLGPKVTRG